MTLTYTMHVESRKNRVPYLNRSHWNDWNRNIVDFFFAFSTDRSKNDCLNLFLRWMSIKSKCDFTKLSTTQEASIPHGNHVCISKSLLLSCVGFSIKFLYGLFRHIQNRETSVTFSFLNDLSSIFDIHRTARFLETQIQFTHSVRQNIQLDWLQDYRSPQNHNRRSIQDINSI